MSLIYEKKGDFILVKCEKKYDKILKNLDCEWDEDNDVWVTSIDNEKTIRNLVKKEKLESISSNVKSVSSQKKYIRDIEHDIFNSSDDEDDYEEDYREDKGRGEKNISISDLDSGSGSASEEDNKRPNNNIIERDVERRNKYPGIISAKDSSNSKNKYRRNIDHSPDKLKFSKNMVKIERGNRSKSSASSKDSLSSSSRSASSEDDFPSPATPKRRVSYMKTNKNDYESLIDQIHNHQKRVHKIEKEKK